VSTLAEPEVFSTFRDPAGSVEIRPDAVYRQVRAPYDIEILEFLQTPLVHGLVENGSLIESEVVAQAGTDGQPLILRHPRIDFPSYPWEWAPSMWLSAAELTLGLCAGLLDQGWILKDATPLNVLFRGTKPVFVDVLSICRADLSEPIWYAYGQFIRTFLLPVLAYSKLGWPLQASMLKRDGYEPEELSSALPWQVLLRQPALSSVTLPRMMTKLQGKGTKTGKSSDSAGSRFTREPEVNRQVIRKTLSALSKHMKQATPPASASHWSAYAQTLTHYDVEDQAAKRDFVAERLQDAKPARVLDVGCNIGVYSALASDTGAEVVAIDTDMQTIDHLCRRLEGTGKNILPLCVDVARPTPAVGWLNRENASFLDRCRGNFDMVMMLAVVHHLLVGSQIPLSHIAALCGDLTTRGLIIEWVPPTDPKFREITRGRDSLYAELTEAGFRSAFEKHFLPVRQTALTNGRILFHFEKR
jgi:SAM-dependent methyltransferase